MLTAVFIESSFDVSLLPKLDSLFYLPAVRRGDIYKACTKFERLIIVDGLFANVRSVWHREIIYALSIGVQVFGCSSMGALRASELVSYGMMGSGWVYEKLLNAEIVADDEVSLIYSFGPSGNLIIESIPLCNIMWILYTIYGLNYHKHQEVNEIIERIQSDAFNNRTLMHLKEVAFQILPSHVAKLLIERLHSRLFDIKAIDFIELLGNIYGSDFKHLLKSSSRLKYGSEYAG